MEEVNYIKEDAFKVVYPDRATVSEKYVANDADFKIDEKPADYWLNGAGKYAAWYIAFRFYEDIAFPDNSYVNIFVGDKVIENKRIVFFEGLYSIDFSMIPDPEEEGEGTSQYLLIREILDTEPIYISAHTNIQARKHLVPAGIAKLRMQDVEGEENKLNRNWQPITTVEELDRTVQDGFYSVNLIEGDYAPFGNNVFTLSAMEVVDSDIATQTAVVYSRGIVRQFVRSLSSGNAAGASENYGWKELIGTAEANTIAEWIALNPIVPKNEIVIELGPTHGTNKIKIGTGEDNYLDLAYFGENVFQPKFENLVLLKSITDVIPNGVVNGDKRYSPSANWIYTYNNGVWVNESTQESRRYLYKFGNSVYIYLQNLVKISTLDSYINYHFGHLINTPQNNQELFIGCITDLSPTTQFSNSRCIINQVNGIIEDVSVMIYVGGAFGSAESSVFYICNQTKGTTSLITDVARHNVLDSITNYSLLSPLAVDKGDKIYIKWITPTWVTKPTTIRQHFDVKIKTI